LVVAEAFMATVLACCAGGIVSLVTLRMLTGYWRICETINGCLAGMVSVCCGCDALAPWAAAVSGTVAGFVYLGVSMAMQKLKIDDPIDAVAVHGGFVCLFV
jgi:Amt family ammonium transporter